MKVRLKFPDGLLSAIRADLRRPHRFAHERVGFVLGGAAWVGTNLDLLARGYLSVHDDDYVYNPSVGAEIGRNAMRNALECAYTSKASLIHIHTHGGLGTPEFSEPDLNSAPRFVPGFFNTVPTHPHGIVVLSDDSATGLLWISKDHRPVAIKHFAEVGSTLKRFGEQP